MKLVLWWEEEYVAAYRKSSGFIRKKSGSSGDNLEEGGDCEGVVKASDPKKFVQAISSSAKNLLGEHPDFSFFLFHLLDILFNIQDFTPLFHYLSGHSSILKMKHKIFSVYFKITYT